MNHDDLQRILGKPGYAVADTSTGPTAPVTPEPKVQARFEIKPSTDERKLNKTEAAYLSHLRQQGHQWVGVQSLTLKLGDDCRFTPDFWVITKDGALVFHETKGFMRDDALVKLKTAARQFPFASFLLVKRKAGTWEIREINN